jgi:hypothetical protein
MGQAFQGAPFLREGSDNAELDIAWIMETGGARQGLEQSGFPATAIARHQQRPRSWVIQIKQDRQTVFGQPEQKRSAGQARRRFWGDIRNGNLRRNRQRRLFMGEFRLDFLVSIESEQKLVSCGHGDLSGERAGMQGIR